ncbi:hypothetical protein GCM10009552_42510 [Rothia nasimurium]|nr:serine hydrolase domain-containing protein [Luteibacter anthropi]
MRYWGAIAALGFSTLSGHAMATGPRAAALDAYLNHACEAGQLNGNVLIADHGEVILRKAYGYADASRNVPLSISHRFDIGSIGKEFDATGIMMLAEDGRLSLSDPVSRFIPDLPPWSRAVTLNDLLHYTSGLPGIDKNTVNNDADALRNLRALKQLDFPPGTQYAYNNNNTFLRRRIIENVSGMNYSAFLKTRVFPKAGITDAVIDPVDGIPRIARGFTADFKEDPLKVRLSGWPAVTVDDLFRWSNCVTRFCLITPDSTRRILTTGNPRWQTGFGHGEMDGDHLIRHVHDGSNYNFEALLMADPIKGRTLILLTSQNRNDVYAMADAINAILDNQPAGVSVAKAGATSTPDTRADLMASGSLRTNLHTGVVKGDICMTHRPEALSGAFVLNTGLNVAKVTDGQGNAVSFDGSYGPDIDGEARIYTVTHAPPMLCVQYVGALPIYPAHDAPGDFKGIMAFNGDSFRFSEQSAWLPLPYDPKARVRAGDMAYHLDVTCDDCRFIYANGDAPLEGTEATFHSDIARPPMIFGGTGPITKTANVTILNESVDATSSEAMSGLVGKVQSYYQDYMGKAMMDRPVFLRMITIDQVRRDRTGSGWGFATWPTIAFSGSVGKIGTTLLAGGDKADQEISYLAHELGHYYFGTLVRPQGPYAWFLLESNAEFLSMKALRAIRGKAAADKRVAHWAEQAAKQKEAFIPLDKVTQSGDISESYRYSYGPFLLLSLEQQVGEKKMRAFMRALLTAPVITSWEDLHRVALGAGIRPDDWNHWQKTCVATGKPICGQPAATLTPRGV